MFPAFRRSTPCRCIETTDIYRISVMPATLGHCQLADASEFAATMVAARFVSFHAAAPCRWILFATMPASARCCHIITSPEKEMFSTHFRERLHFSFLMRLSLSPGLRISDYFHSRLKYIIYIDFSIWEAPLIHLFFRFMHAFITLLRLTRLYH